MDTIPPEVADQARDRFWSSVEMRAPDECWPWLRFKNDKGYGITKVTINKRRYNSKTQRLAWLLTFGDIPDGLHVLHTCDNPPCCNPAHLFLGTNGDNMRDKVEKGRHKRRITTPSRLHLAEKFISSQGLDEQYAAYVRAQRRLYRKRQ